MLRCCTWKNLFNPFQGGYCIYRRLYVCEQLSGHNSMPIVTKLLKEHHSIYLIIKRVMFNLLAKQRRQCESPAQRNKNFSKEPLYIQKCY